MTNVTHPLLQGLRIGVLGAGNMGLALIDAWLRLDLLRQDQIRATDTHHAKRAELEARGVGYCTTNAELAKFADVLILATKPQAFERVLQEISVSSGPAKLIVSIAAGIRIKTIEDALADGSRVVRTMPNTPALVGAGATAIAAGTLASEADLAISEALFSALGIVEILDESLLDAVTGLSGSGPAFVFVIIEALADAGVKVGLHRSTALRFAAQTVYGAAKLQLETGEHPGVLKDKVASPGGTTISGLHTLEAGGLRRTLMDAVERATERSIELGSKKT